MPDNTAASEPERASITAFARSPDRGRGLARDMRVRWALEEVGKPYGVQLVSFEEMKQPGHRALQPFGQIPTYEEGGIVLFESGAIILHVAESHPGLLPGDRNARARAVSWMFAALNTLEPPILERETAGHFERHETWYQQRLAAIEGRIHGRLRDLSTCLDDAHWLEGEFSAGDLLVVSVLQRLSGSGIVEEYPNLQAYVARAEARPAFRRAFDAQLAAFLEASGG